MAFIFSVLNLKTCFLDVSCYINFLCKIDFGEHNDTSFVLPKLKNGPKIIHRVTYQLQSSYMVTTHICILFNPQNNPVHQESSSLSYGQEESSMIPLAINSGGKTGKSNLMEKPML